MVSTTLIVFMSLTRANPFPSQSLRLSIGFTVCDHHHSRLLPLFLFTENTQFCSSPHSIAVNSSSPPAMCVITTNLGLSHLRLFVYFLVAEYPCRLCCLVSFMVSVLFFCFFFCFSPFSFFCWFHFLSALFHLSPSHLLPICDVLVLSFCSFFVFLCFFRSSLFLDDSFVAESPCCLYCLVFLFLYLLSIFSMLIVSFLTVVCISVSLFRFFMFYCLFFVCFGFPIIVGSSKYFYHPFVICLFQSSRCYAQICEWSVSFDGWFVSLILSWFSISIFVHLHLHSAFAVVILQDMILLHPSMRPIACF